MPQYFQRPYGRAATVDFTLFEADGVDFRTDATVGTADLFVMKDEGTEANATNAATDEGRGYSLVLTATEMSAARVTVYVEDQTATKVWLDETLVIETTNHPSATHANGVTEAGTAQAGAASTITLRSGASSTNDLYLGQIITIVSGTAAGQSKPITAYVGGTKVATVSGSWATNPDSTSVYEIRGDAVSEVTIPTAADNADAVLDEVLAGHTTAGTLGKAIADVEADTSELQGTGVNVVKVVGEVLALDGDGNKNIGSA